jgi:hypothetical protein
VRVALPVRLKGEPVALVLVACLILATLAGALDAPSGVRAPLTVLGVLLAPGWVWLAALGRRQDGVATAVLAAALSLAATCLTGVGLNALGLPVTGVAVAVGLLVLTLPAVAFIGDGATAPAPVLRGRAITRRRISRAVPVAVAAALFVGAVAWGASWMHLVDTGAYARLNYGGPLAQLSGPVTVRPSAAVTVPLQVTTSNGKPWAGVLEVREGGRVLSRATVRLRSGAVARATFRAPAAPGLRQLTISATPDAVTAKVAHLGSGLGLTLRVRVVAGHG